MAKSSIPIASDARVPTESRSQVEVEGTTIVDFQGMFVADVGVSPRPRPLYLATAAPSKLLNVDGSASDVLYELAPDTDEVLRIKGVRVFMRCTGAITFTGFGDLAALTATNGLLLSMHDGTNVLADQLAGDEILTTEDFLPFAERFELLDSGLVLIADLMFASVMRLVWTATALPRLRATVRADLSSILELTMLALVADETVLT